MVDDGPVDGHAALGGENLIESIDAVATVATISPRRNGARLACGSRSLNMAYRLFTMSDEASASGENRCILTQERTAVLRT
eukprot:scaffold161396_cov30-Tisochrysis_lutea.AAC.3